MMQVKEDLLLPIGSVVKLLDRNVMITGYFPISNGKLYVYTGCDFPEGVKNFDEIYCFNKDDILAVLYKNYMSEECKNYINDISIAVLEINNSILKINNN